MACGIKRFNVSHNHATHHRGVRGIQSRQYGATRVMRPVYVQRKEEGPILHLVRMEAFKAYFRVAAS